MNANELELYNRTKSKYFIFCLIRFLSYYVVFYPPNIRFFGTLMEDFGCSGAYSFMFMPKITIDTFPS